MKTLGRLFIAIIVMAFAINESNAQSMKTVHIMEDGLDRPAMRSVYYDIILNDYEAIGEPHYLWTVTEETEYNSVGDIIAVWSIGDESLYLEFEQMKFGSYHVNQYIYKNK